VAADLFSADLESERGTDMTKLNVAFWNGGTCLKWKSWQKYNNNGANYLPTALHQAAKSMNCMTMSTGI